MIDDTTVCPYCRETIKREAIRCKHCQAALASPTMVGSYNTTGGAFGFTIGGSGNVNTGDFNLTLGELEQVDPSQYLFTVAGVSGECSVRSGLRVP